MTHFNPLDKFYKSTVGAVAENEKVIFRVKGEFNECNFVYGAIDGDAFEFLRMEKKGDFFETEISFSRGLYSYYFSVGDEKFIGLDKNYRGVISGSPKPFQLLAYSKDYVTPEWIKGGIIYQIFPDRFNRGEKEKKIKKGKILRSDFDGIPYFKPNEQGRVLNNDFFGGDFKGIEQKLDYLTTLGVSAIYLNPIFEAYSNHRYDTGDYNAIDSLLGSEQDFLSLIRLAKEKGISIILDGVFNHTGVDSVYFNKFGTYDSVGAYQSPVSKYAGWYKFIEYPDEYESWWGIKDLPALDKENSDYVEFITGKAGVIAKYTNMGIGGWRLDVVDELPDNLVKKIRKAVKDVNRDAVVIGEVWEDATNKVSYGKRRKYFWGDELDSVMNYPLKDAIINYVLTGDSENLNNVIKEQIDHYPETALNSLMNILSTHDTYRLLSAVGGVDVSGLSKEQKSKIKIPASEYLSAVKRHKAAVLLSYTLYGVPSVYYGDEIGMQGYTDPLNRAFYTWNDIDEDLLSFYIKLGKLRRDLDVFKSGKTEIIKAENGIFAFKRAEKTSEIFVALNFGENAVNLSFNGELKEYISGKRYNGAYELKSYGFAVLINDKC